MSENEILYVKGIKHSSQSENADIWDDSKLNNAYDKAINIANIEVAKRVAMSTNTDVMPAKKENDKQGSSKKTKSKVQSLKSKGPKLQWQSGMPCRAIYEEDGLEYEAFVLNLISDKDCVVQFLGYNNLQKVSLSSLKPSLEKQEQAFQIEQAALHSKEDDGVENHSVEDMETLITDFAHQHNKKNRRKKNEQTFSLPDIPMPDMSMIKNLGSMDMPLPPPPPLHMSYGSADGEEQAISSMLLSWYMSGYYTGLYLGMKRAKEDRKNVDEK